MRYSTTYGCALLLMLATTMLTAGCRGKPKKEPPPPRPPLVHTVKRGYGHEAALPLCALTVSAPAEARPPKRLFAPDKGMHYTAITVAIKNTGDGPLIYSTFDFRLRDATGREYDPHFHQFLDPALNAGTLKPSQSINGKIVFQIPDKAKILGVTYFTNEPGSDRVVFEAPEQE